jgi:hypothetical protein
MKIARESWLILVIGLADLVTTIVFIRAHGAQEANPLFRRYWEMSPAAFVVAKLMLLAGPLAILEWARRRNPRFVMFALRTAIAGYVVMYGVGYYRLNGPTAYANEMSRYEIHSAVEDKEYVVLAGLPDHLASWRRGPGKRWAGSPVRAADLIKREGADVAITERDPGTP